MPDRLQELAKQMAGSPANTPAPVQHSDADVDLWGHNETPQPIGQQALGMAKDFGKGVGESAVGLMSTGDEFARKHLPAFLTNSNMGFGPPADLEKVKQLGTPVNNTQAVGAGLGDALQSMIPIEKAIPFAGKLLAKLPIPTRAKAGALFDQVMAAAEHEPVQLNRAMQPLERAQQLSASGHGTVGAADKLYNRINTVNPIPYREARDWASGLSNITGEGKMSATPTLQAQVGKLSHAFNQDVGDAAARSGVGNEYNAAMQTYARAMQLRKALINTAKVGGGALATGYLAHRLIPAVLPDR